MTIYCIVDESTAPELKSSLVPHTDNPLVTMKRDIQIAFDTDFAPLCGVLPVDIRVCALSDAPENARIMHIVDSIDDAPGALAYHTVDDHGRPTLRLGVNQIRAVGGSLLDNVSETLSHEIFETQRNPFVNRYLDGPWQGKKVADEACDPVQGSGYRHGQTLISNFTLPAWGDIGDVDGPWDFQKVLIGPFECAPTGYLAFDDGSQAFGASMHPLRKTHAENYARTVGYHHPAIQFPPTDSAPAIDDPGGDVL